MLSDLSVCDAGDTVKVRLYVNWDNRVLDDVAEREVVMVIRAPRGRAVIFKPRNMPPYYGDYIPQSEAVRAFVEQHRENGSG